jgi:hypothetical protein
MAEKKYERLVVDLKPYTFQQLKILVNLDNSNYHTVLTKIINKEHESCARHIKES